MSIILGERAHRSKSIEAIITGFAPAKAPDNSTLSTSKAKCRHDGPAQMCAQELREPLKATAKRISSVGMPEASEVQYGPILTELATI